MASSKERTATNIVTAVGVGFAFFSIGASSPVPISVTEAVIAAAAFLSLSVYQRVRVDDVSLHLAAFTAAAIGSGLLNAGSGIAGEAGRSLARLFFWVIAFQLLQIPLSRADYSDVARRLLNFSVLLSLLHYLQLTQVMIGLSPLSLPAELIYRGELRWFNPTTGWRPAVIFSEVSWYAIYQCTLMALVLLWLERAGGYTRGELTKLTIVAGSVVLSRSLAGEILLLGILLLSVWRVIRRGKYRAQLPLYALLYLVLAFLAVKFAGIGEYTLQRATVLAASGSFVQRFVGPLVWVRSVMASSPVFGIGLGNETVGYGGVIVTGVEIRLVSALVYFLGTVGVVGVALLLLLILRIARKSGGSYFIGNTAWFLVLSLSHGDALLPAFWVPLMLWYGAACYVAAERGLHGRSIPYLTPPQQPPTALLEAANPGPEVERGYGATT